MDLPYTPLCHKMKVKNDTLSKIFCEKLKFLFATLDSPFSYVILISQFFSAGAVVPLEICF